MTDSNDVAVIDSYIDDIHIQGFDSVRTGVTGCPGPIKISNNFVSGVDRKHHVWRRGRANYNPWVPSDIEIRGNYIFKPLSWVVASVTNRKMSVKNALEMKSAQRVLFDGNTIENVWAKLRQAPPSCSLRARRGVGDIAVVNDITITNNVLKNVVSGFNTGGADDTCAWPQKGRLRSHRTATTQDHRPAGASRTT